MSSSNCSPTAAARDAAASLEETTPRQHTLPMTITLSADLEKLPERAAQSRGLPVDAYARAVLQEAVKFDREALLAEIDTIRAMRPPHHQTDSVELLQQVRAERYDR